MTGHRSRSLLMGVAMLALSLSTGCGGGPGEQEFSNLLLASAGQQDLAFATEDVRVLSIASASEPNCFAVEFSAQARLETDLLQQRSLEEAYRALGYDQSEYTTAESKAAELRSPERKVVAMANVRAERIPPIYEPVAKAGDVFNWTGKALVEQGANDWEIVDLQARLPERLNSDALLTTSELPSDVILLGTAKESRLAEEIAQQKRFIAAVKTAHENMAARLEREHRMLLDVAQVGKAWSLLLPNSRGSQGKFLARVIECEGNADHVTILVEDPTDPLRRVAMVGAMELEPQPRGERWDPHSLRPSLDGWSLTLKVDGADEQQILSAVRGQLQFVVNDHTAIVCVGHPQVEWTSVEATPLPPVNEARADLDLSTTAGSTWNGSLQFPSQPALPIRMTFVETRQDTHYVRLTVQPTASPGVVAVFEGSIAQDVPALYCWPLILSRSSSFGDLNVTDSAAGKPMFLRSGSSNVCSLRLAWLDDQNVVGLVLNGSHQPGIIKLTKGVAIQPYQPSQSRWTEALAVGSHWEGKLTYKDQQPASVVLAVVEASRELDDIHLVAWDIDDPHRFAHLKGKVDRSDGIVDGYALTVQRTTSSPHLMYPGGESHHAFFGAFSKFHPELRQKFFLSADGKSLHGVSSGEELLTLTRITGTTKPSPGRDQRIEQWRQRFAKNAVLTGTLENVRAKASAQVTLRVTREMDPDGNIAVALETAQAPGVKVMFEGRLLGQEDALFGHGLVLEKRSTGEGSSVVFGSGAKASLYLRLAIDGSHIFGMARDDDTWSEFGTLTAPAK